MSSSDETVVKRPTKMILLFVGLALIGSAIGFSFFYYTFDEPTQNKISQEIEPSLPQSIPLPEELETNTEGLKIISLNSTSGVDDELLIEWIERRFFEHVEYGDEKLMSFVNADPTWVKCLGKYIEEECMGIKANYHVGFEEDVFFENEFKLKIAELVESKIPHYPYTIDFNSTAITISWVAFDNVS